MSVQHRCGRDDSVQIGIWLPHTPGLCHDTFYNTLLSCIAGASSFQEWFAIRRVGEDTAFAAGSARWDSTKAAYTFAEGLPGDGNRHYRAAVLEVNPASPHHCHLQQGQL